MIRTLADLYQNEEFRGLDLNDREQVIRNFADRTGNSEQADFLVSDYDKRFRAANGTPEEREILPQAIASEDRFSRGEITREQHLEELAGFATQLGRRQADTQALNVEFDQAALRAEQLGIGEGDSLLQEASSFTAFLGESIFGQTEASEQGDDSLQSFRQRRTDQAISDSVQQELETGTEVSVRETVEEARASLQQELDIGKSAIRQDFEGAAIQLPDGRIQLKEDLLFRNKNEVREELRKTDIPSGQQLLFLRDQFDQLQETRAAQYAEVLSGYFDRTGQEQRLRTEGESNLEFVNRVFGAEADNGAFVGTIRNTGASLANTVEGLLTGSSSAILSAVGQEEEAVRLSEEGAQNQFARTILSGQRPDAPLVAEVVGQLPNIIPAAKGAQIGGRVGQALNLSNRGRAIAQTAGIAAGSFGSSASSQLQGALSSLGDRPISDAYEDAFNSGAIEAVFSTLGAGGGVESILRSGLGNSLRGNFAQSLTRIGLNATEEAVEEGVTEALQFLVTEFRRNPEATSQDLSESIGQGALIGGILGGGFSAVSQISTPAQETIEAREIVPAPEPQPLPSDPAQEVRSELPAPSTLLGQELETAVQEAESEADSVRQTEVDLTASNQEVRRQLEEIGRRENAEAQPNQGDETNSGGIPIQPEQEVTSIDPEEVVTNETSGDSTTTEGDGGTRGILPPTNSVVDQNPDSLIGSFRNNSIQNDQTSISQDNSFDDSSVSDPTQDADQSEVRGEDTRVLDQGNRNSDGEVSEQRLGIVQNESQFTETSTEARSEERGSDSLGVESSSGISIRQQQLDSLQVGQRIVEGEASHEITSITPNENGGITVEANGLGTRTFENESTVNVRPEGVQEETRLYSIPFVDTGTIINTAQRIFQATQTAAEFTTQLVQQVGERVRPIAQRLFEDVRRFVADRAFDSLERFLDFTGSRTFVVPNSGRETSSEGSGESNIQNEADPSPATSDSQAVENSEIDPDIVGDTSPPTPTDPRTVTSSLLKTLQGQADLGQLRPEDVENIGDRFDFLPASFDGWRREAIRYLFSKAPENDVTLNGALNIAVNDLTRLANEGSFRPFHTAAAAIVAKQLSQQGRGQEFIEFVSTLRSQVATDAGQLVKSFDSFNFLTAEGKRQIINRTAVKRVRGKVKTETQRRKGEQIEDELINEQDSIEENQEELGERLLEEDLRRVTSVLDSFVVSPQRDGFLIQQNKGQRDLNASGGRTTDRQILDRYFRQKSYSETRLTNDLVEAGVSLEGAKVITEAARIKKNHDEILSSAKAKREYLERERQAIDARYIADLKRLIPQEGQPQSELNPFQRIARENEQTPENERVTQEEIEAYALENKYTNSQRDTLVELAHDAANRRSEQAAERATQNEIIRRVRARLKKSRRFNDDSLRFYNQILADLVRGRTLDEALRRFEGELDTSPDLQLGILDYLETIENTGGTFRVQAEEKLIQILEEDHQGRYHAGLGDLFQASILSPNSFLRAFVGSFTAKGARITGIILRDTFRLFSGDYNFTRTGIELEQTFGRRTRFSIRQQAQALWDGLPQDANDEFYGSRDTLRRDFFEAYDAIQDPSNTTAEKLGHLPRLIFSSQFLNFKILGTIDVPIRESTRTAEALINNLESVKAQLIKDGQSEREAERMATNQILSLKRDISLSQIEGFHAQATEEFQTLSGGRAPDKRQDRVNINLRALELQEDSAFQAEDIREGSQAANELAMIGEPPPGAYRELASILRRISNAGPANFPIGKILVPFPNIIANATRISVDTAGGGLLTGVWNDQLSDGEIRRARQRALSGPALMMFILGLDSLSDEDEEFNVTVHGDGPKEKGERDRFFQDGGKVYSIEVKVTGRSFFIPYGSTPLALVMGGYGSLRDTVRYADDGQTRIENINSGLFRGSKVIGEFAGLRSLRGILGNDKFSTEKDFGQRLSASLLNPLGSIAVPHSGTNKFIRRLYGNEVLDTRGEIVAQADNYIGGAFVGNTISKGIAIPADTLGFKNFSEAARSNPATAERRYDYQGNPVTKSFFNRLLGAAINLEERPGTSSVESHLNENGIYNTGFVDPPKVEFGTGRSKVERTAFVTYLKENGEAKTFTPEQSLRFQRNSRKTAERLRILAEESIREADPELKDTINRSINTLSRRMEKMRLIGRSDVAEQLERDYRLPTQ